MPLKQPRIPRRSVVKLYVGEWINRLGRKPVEIAKAVDITESYLSEIISGRKPNPSLVVLFAIADELGLTVNDLRRPPPAQTAIEAAQRLEPGQLAALGRLLDELKTPKK